MARHDEEFIKRRLTSGQPMRTQVLLTILDRYDFYCRFVGGGSSHITCIHETYTDIPPFTITAETDKLDSQKAALKACLTVIDRRKKEGGLSDGIKTAHARAAAERDDAGSDTIPDGPQDNSWLETLENSLSSSLELVLNEQGTPFVRHKKWPSCGAIITQETDAETCYKLIGDIHRQANALEDLIAKYDLKPERTEDGWVLFEHEVHPVSFFVPPYDPDEISEDVDLEHYRAIIDNNDEVTSVILAPFSNNEHCDVRTERNKKNERTTTYGFWCIYDRKHYELTQVTTENGRVSFKDAYLLIQKVQNIQKNNLLKNLREHHGFEAILDGKNLTLKDRFFGTTYTMENPEMIPDHSALLEQYYVLWHIARDPYQISEEDNDLIGPFFDSIKRASDAFLVTEKACINFWTRYKDELNPKVIKLNEVLRGKIPYEVTGKMQDGKPCKVTYDFSNFGGSAVEVDIIPLKTPEGSHRYVYPPKTIELLSNLAAMHKVANQEANAQQAGVLAGTGGLTRKGPVLA